MTASKSRQGMPVTPGDEVGVEEEYFPGNGVYVDDKGIIRSQLVGRVLIDIVKRNISVRHVKGKPYVPKVGDVVEGIISGISEDIVFVDIYAIEEKPSKSTDFTGIIHVSQVSQEYIETMYDAFRLGDVIRARVITNYQPYQLTTKEPGLGVIVAFCSKCGAILRKKDNRLVCPVCGNVENRKISVMYLFR